MNLDHEQWNYIFDALSYRIDDFVDAIEEIKESGKMGETKLPEPEYIIQLLQEKIQQHEQILCIIQPNCQ